VASIEEKNTVSPARNIQHKAERVDNLPFTFNNSNYRSIDGSGNNMTDLSMGSVFVQLFRIVLPDYADGISEISGSDRPSPREISNVVLSQNTSIVNELGATDYLWQWGQFLDHDIDLTDGVDPPENENIPVPTGDIFFDPDSTGTAVIEFNRSIYDKNTGSDISNPRQQINEITAWIDASNIYGSDSERSSALRTNDGTGMMKMQNNLLTFNTQGFPNAGGDGDDLFLSGDVRANEQVGLTAMHTLFSREHNRLAIIIGEENSTLTGDEIYEEARKIVGAQMQAITYKEFLPLLIGEGRISDYNGYNPNINSNIMNVFSTAAYRFGHSALSPTLLRLNQDNETITDGNLALRDAFFNPSRIIDEGGIEPLLRGLAAQECQKIDNLIIDDVRNFLFGPPGAGGFDLASLNIQRGRDHGLPGYNEVRDELGLGRLENFSDISSNSLVQQRLLEAYGNVDQIDLWVGGLSEDPLQGSHLGELFSTLIAMQFEALRDGDRFWYELVFSGDELEELQNTKLSDVIRRNTDIGNEIQDNVFLISLEPGSDGGCSLSSSSDKNTLYTNILFILSLFLVVSIRRKCFNS